MTMSESEGYTALTIHPPEGYEVVTDGHTVTFRKIVPDHTVQIEHTCRKPVLEDEGSTWAGRWLSHCSIFLAHPDLKVVENARALLEDYLDIHLPALNAEEFAPKE